MRTEDWQKNMLGLRLVGEEENGSASSPFGPQRAGLTTSLRISKEAQLLGLLNSLEKEVENLQSKYCEAYVTLMNVMEHLVRLGVITKNITIIDKEEENK